MSISVEEAARLGFKLTETEAKVTTRETLENNFLDRMKALDAGNQALAITPEARGSQEKVYGPTDEWVQFVLGLKRKEDGTYPWYLSEAANWHHLGQTFVGREWLGPESEEEAEDEEEEIARRAGKDKKKAKKKEPNSVPVPYRAQILKEEPSFVGWLGYRDKARKDLFWLGVSVLKKNWVSETHQQVCDQFVQKNFDGVYHPGYNLTHVQSAFDTQKRFDGEGRPTKEMILLDSRGFFKSTIDGVDCIQWMLNVPDIRIMIVTATKELARGFMKEIKNYLFYQPHNEESTSLDLHLLFPDYILSKAPSENNTPLLLRVRKHWQKDKSVSISSMESGQAGAHCDVLKRDDCTNEQNCTPGTPKPTLALLNSKINTTGNIPMPWGFIDNIGTRYRADDWFGQRIALLSVSPAKYFCRACWVVKEQYKAVPLKQLTEEMVVLNFPKLSKTAFQDLRMKLAVDEMVFRCQQLNEPAMEAEEDKFKIAFTIEELRRSTIHPSAAAKEGNIYIAWDTAYSKNKQSDYSAGAAARRFRRADGRWGLEILEIRHGKWTSSELAQQIAQMDKDWNPVQTIIEKTINAELLELRLQEWYKRLDFLPRIWWREPNPEPDAKRNRIKQLEILLVADLLKFVFGVAKKQLDWIDPTFDQLTSYTGERKNKGRKDDIPDAMSMLWYFLPLHVPTQQELDLMQQRQELLWQAHARQVWQKAMFGGWGTQKPQQPSLIPNMAPPTADQRRGAMSDAGKRLLGPGFRI